MATEERQDVAAPAREHALQATSTIKATATNRVRDELDTRSTQAADQITPYAEALRRAGHHLEGQGSTAGGQAAGKVADRVQQFSDYLRRSDADRFLGDIESFARRRPWAAGGAGVVLGFLGARFLKASAETRYSMQPPATHNPYTIPLPVSDTLPPGDMPLTRETDETDETVGGW